MTHCHSSGRSLRPRRRGIAALGCAVMLLGSVAHGANALRPACDVALRPDGSLAGRVLAADEEPGRESSSAVRVRLVREGRVVAETAPDSHGAFVLRNLRGGLCQVVVVGPDGAGCRACRLWPASVAPPGGLREVTVLMGRPLVRAQGPIPPNGIPTAAVLTVIAAGAIAAPAIYKSTKSEPHISASP